MTVDVNAPTTPTFNQILPICSGGTFTLPATSIEGFTGTWSPAVNNTTTTTYTFTPTVGQCANTATLQVTVNSQITPSFNLTFCFLYSSNSPFRILIVFSLVSILSNSN